MSEYMFGIIHERPTKKNRDLRDRICKHEGGHGFYETWVGGYRGWFSGPNHGHPFDAELGRRVLACVAQES